jgi:hypothetical protein
MTFDAHHRNHPPYQYWTEQALLAVVARALPELAPAELSQALQVATTAAERKVAARH